MLTKDSSRSSSHGALTILTTLGILLMLQGCLKRNVESSIHGLRFDIVGEHYLMLQDHKEGLTYFSEAVEKYPDNPEACYFTGRFLLASGDPKKAIGYFKKATTLLPDEPDYHFWLGVAYGESKKTALEKKSYQNALDIDKKHLQALIYLGNNQMRQKQYTKALDMYQRALLIWPYSPSALYNRALASKYLNRTPEEETAWLEYLKYYPSGALARRAVNNLNKLGNFTYRVQHLGARALSLPEIQFTPLRSTINKKSYSALNTVGATVANMGSGTLHVLTYQKNNLSLAKSRAFKVKKYLSEKFPELKGNRIRVSWFSSPEKVRLKGRTFRVGESVRFILTPEKK